MLSKKSSGFAIAAALAVTVVLAGCSSQASSETSTTSSPIAEQDPVDTSTESTDDGIASGDAACQAYGSALPASTEITLADLVAPFTASLPTEPDCVFQAATGSETQYYLLWGDGDFAAIHAGLSAGGFVDVSTWENGPDKKYALSNADGTGYFPLTGGVDGQDYLTDTTVTFVWAH